MDAITSLNGLIETLKQSDARDYVKVAKGMKIPVSDFDKYAHFKGEGYTRNCVVKTTEFELILICWKKNAITPIHCHNEQHCWVYQVDGEMTEIRYQKDDQDNLSESNNMLVTPGMLTYMHDSMGYHLLENHTSENAMTLHLYMKPVESCTAYNNSTNCFEEKELIFHSYEGELIKELI